MLSTHRNTFNEPKHNICAVSIRGLGTPQTALVASDQGYTFRLQSISPAALLPTHRVHFNEPKHDIYTVSNRGVGFSAGYPGCSIRSKLPYYFRIVLIYVLNHILTR